MRKGFQLFLVKVMERCKSVHLIVATVVKKWEGGHPIRKLVLKDNCG